MSEEVDQGLITLTPGGLMCPLERTTGPNAELLFASESDGYESVC